MNALLQAMMQLVRRAGATGERDGDGGATAAPMGLEQPGAPGHRQRGIVDVTVAATCRPQMRNMALDNITPGVATNAAVRRKMDQYLAPLAAQVEAADYRLRQRRLPSAFSAHRPGPLDQGSDARARRRGHRGLQAHVMHGGWARKVGPAGSGRGSDLATQSVIAWPTGQQVHKNIEIDGLPLLSGRDMPHV